MIELNLYRSSDPPVTDQSECTLDCHSDESDPQSDSESVLAPPTKQQKNK